MASHIVGYPRMGPKRELKFALESFWDGKSSAEDLQKVAADLRCSIWKQMADAGIKHIPSNTFSYYDQMLDTTALLGAVPPRYGWNGGEIGFDLLLHGQRKCLGSMEMTKWFDTNYHFIVPELGPDVHFSYASHKAVEEYKEAKALGVDTVPVLVGPVSYLLLSKPAKGVDKIFSSLSSRKIIPIYKEVVSELKAAGASWIQFDEPTLVMDLDSHKLQAFTDAYSHLESTLSGIVGKDHLVVSSSCSLLHTAVDLVNETKLDNEIKSGSLLLPRKLLKLMLWQRHWLVRRISNGRSTGFRKSSPRVTNEAVQKAAVPLKGCDHRRATNVSARLDAQQKKLKPSSSSQPPPLDHSLRPLNSEGSAVNTRPKKISEEEYVKAIKDGRIHKVVKLQEELDIDVLVHGGA
ncbi:hypothetical protein M0R45_000235 [Rubus argutus]|uniref:5-methyltetrahydropteroyltriglutamate--homocysteine S-methyltransferase n=1 Tax=Rubus argutus TaxID=59490 RepID=A0AAW1VP13_RUBAR